MTSEETNQLYGLRNSTQKTQGKIIMFEHHDDIIKWKHFPRYWPFVRGIHRPPMNSPHKGQWRGALTFSLIWINGWSKQWRRRWFETPSRPFWRYCNGPCLQSHGIYLMTEISIISVDMRTWISNPLSFHPNILPFQCPCVRCLWRPKYRDLSPMWNTTCVIVTMMKRSPLRRPLCFLYTITVPSIGLRRRLTTVWSSGKCKKKSRWGRRPLSFTLITINLSWTGIPFDYKTVGWTTTSSVSVMSTKPHCVL